MDPAQLGKPIPEMPAKEAAQPTVGVDAQELTNHFDGQHFRITQPRLQTARSQEPISQPVVNQTLNANQKSGNIHGRDLLV